MLHNSAGACGGLELRAERDEDERRERVLHADPLLAHRHRRDPDQPDHVHCGLQPLLRKDLRRDTKGSKNEGKMGTKWHGVVPTDTIKIPARVPKFTCSEG